MRCPDRSNLYLPTGERNVISGSRIISLLCWQNVGSNLENQGFSVTITPCHAVLTCVSNRHTTAASFEMFRGFSGLKGKVAILGQLARQYSSFLSKNEAEGFQKILQKLRPIKQASRNSSGGTMVVKQTAFHNERVYDEMVRNCNFRNVCT